MKFKFDDNINPQKKLTQLTIFALIGSVLCALLGGLFLVVTIPFLAVIISLESSSESKLFSVLSCILSLLVSFVLGGYYVVFGFAAILSAFVIYYYASHEKEKSECVAIITVIISLSLFISFALEAITVTGVYSLQAIIDYYSSIFADAKSAFLESFEMQVNNMSYNADDVSAILDSMSLMFDTMMYSALSFIVVFSFGICGFSLKLYTVLMRRNSKNGMAVARWRFSLSSVIAYSTAVIIVLSFFASGSNDLFSLTVVNLYNIFSVIFAYVGFNVALVFISSKFGISKAWIILILALVIGSSFISQLLTIIGLYITIISNRMADAGDMDHRDDF